LCVLHPRGRLELERRDDGAGMVGRHLPFHGELAAALFDEVADLEELLVDLVVDLVLLRSRREEADGWQGVVAAPQLAADWLLRGTGGGALQLRLRPLDRRLIEEARIFEIVVEVGRPGGRRSDVELERIRRLLLRQLLRRLAQIGLRHLADLEPSGAFDLAHERAVGRRRLRAAGEEAKPRRRVDPLEVLADDRLLHPLLAPALGEARPLQRQRASGAENSPLQAAEHRAEADARRQENADEQRRHEYDRRAGAVEIRGGGAIDLRAEVAAGRDERAAQPE